MLRYSKKLFIAGFLLAVLLLINHHFQLYAFTPGTVSEDLSATKFRIMTWNVHVYGPSFKQKQREMAAEILRCDADVVQLNEFDRRVAKQLDSLMRIAYPYVVDKFSSGSGDILYSRYPVEYCQKLDEKVRYSLIYEYRLQVRNQTVRLVGSHLSSNNYDGQGLPYAKKHENKLLDIPHYFANYRGAKQRRTRQAELIRSCLLSEDLPTIVMGDMNDFSGTSPLNTLQKAGLKDAWWEGGNGFGITFHEDWMHFRLDHILYDANWELSSVKVVQSDLSDHRPLVAEFSMK